MRHNQRGSATAIVLGCAISSIFLLGGGCAHQKIAGTQIPDTAEHRAVLAVLEKLRTALEERNAETILSLVSPHYFEDLGTSDPTDDYGYRQLKESILPQSLKVTDEVFITFQIHEVAVEGGKAHADLRYKSRAHLSLPSGGLWDAHNEFNRVQLALEEGRWQIVSGL